MAMRESETLRQIFLGVLTSDHAACIARSWDSPFQAVCINMFGSRLTTYYMYIDEHVRLPGPDNKVNACIGRYLHTSGI